MEVYMKFSRVWRVIEGRMDDTMNGGIVEKKAPISIVKKFIFEMIGRDFLFFSLSICVFEIICFS